MVKLSVVLLNDAQRQELAARQHFYKIVDVPQGGANLELMTIEGCTL